MASILSSLWRRRPIAETVRLASSYRSVVLSATSNSSTLGLRHYQKQSLKRFFSSTPKAFLPVPLSSHFVPTLKASSQSQSQPQSQSQAPDVLPSYLLLLRAGFIRQSSSGIYSLLPNAIRILQKMEKIVDEEMRRIGASKLQMPTLLSSRLWRKSGRMEVMGSELYRLIDRKSAEYVLGPTHEEEVTKLVGDEVESWRSLPVKVYQISQKHRDEPRPRSGLLRTKSFLMKDLYTFDASLEEAGKSYEQVQSAYSKILERILGSEKGAWKVAEADSGSIGGHRSHEYHLEDPAGEDSIISCSACSYSANLERAVSLPHRNSINSDVAQPTDWEDLRVQLFSRGGKLVKERNEEQLNSFGKGAEEDATLTVVLSPKGRELNEIKLFKSLNELSSDATSSKEPFSELPSMPTSNSVDVNESIASWDWKSSPEGPLIQFNKLRILADLECTSLEEVEIFESIKERLAKFCSASQETQKTAEGNEPELWDFFPNQFELTEISSKSSSTSTISVSSHSTPIKFTDLRQVSPGDSCASCATGLLKSTKAIEIAHTFLLGSKYSESLGVNFVSKEEDPENKGKLISKPFQMGCYGIGITRLLGCLAQKGSFEFDKAIELEEKRQAELGGDLKSDGKKKKKEAQRKKGFIWPSGLNPFSALIIPTFPLSPAKEEGILRLELLLNNGLTIPKVLNSSSQALSEEGDLVVPEELLKLPEDDVAIDDRPNLSFGQKLTDSELIGYGNVFVLGNHFDKEGEVEWRSWRKKGGKDGGFEMKKVFIKISG